jgi:hypothetical protein
MKIFRLAEENDNIQLAEENDNIELGDSYDYDNFLKDFQRSNPEIFQELSASESYIDEVNARYIIKAKQYTNDISQYQPLNFKPSFMTVCKISSFSNDLQQNINFEKIKEDYDNLCKLFDNHQSEFTEYLTIYQKLADELDTRYQNKPQQQKIILSAIQAYQAKKAKTEENFEKIKSDMEIFKNQFNILLTPGRNGKSILELYEEIINLGNQGCKICIEAANSFDTPKLGPVTKYVQELIPIYLKISSIYKDDLAQTYSYIASSYKNVSKDKINNTINLLSNIIPQQYTNLIYTAVYALSQGQTFGFDGYPKETLKKFLGYESGQSGESNKLTNPPASLGSIFQK